MLSVFHRSRTGARARLEPIVQEGIVLKLSLRTGEGAKEDFTASLIKLRPLNQVSVEEDRAAVP
jgi:hypothetical protein